MCAHVGDDCLHCYAETMNMRYGNKLPYNHASTSKIRWVLNPKEFIQILKTKPAIIFLGDMYDVFHENMPLLFNKQIFTVMCKANWHIFMILTKRPHLMAKFVDDWVKENGALPEHIWLGTSIGRPKYWKRVEWLKKVDARKRFLSIEPQLESMGHMNLKGINMAIIGGESGNGRRPFKKEWGLQDLRECRRQNVAFFFKQDGDRFPGRRENLLGKIYHEYPIDLDEWHEKAQTRFEIHNGILRGN